MRVVTLNLLRDNFGYLVIDDTIAAVVDPGEAAPVRAALERENVQLAAIWLTHHHHDHVGGVAGLAGPGIEVVAHRSDVSRAPGVTRPVDEGDTVELGRLRAKILHNPGHTTGAISYLVEGCVFTGDTLFGAGCGRLFEGASGDDVRVAAQARRAACGDEGLLRPRVHREQLALRRRRRT